MFTRPVAKNRKVTDATSAAISSIELDPWGSETQSTVNLNTSQQTRKYTTYERDANSSDEAMMRRLGRWGRFEQPDPYDGSYNLSDPQSFNRYSYTENDPVNFIDPTGLCIEVPLEMGETGGVRWISVLCRDQGFLPEPETVRSGGNVGDLENTEQRRDDEPDACTRMAGNAQAIANVLLY